MAVSTIRTPFRVKSTDRRSRRFRGLASTWDLDLGGDVIRKGAFAETLAAWRRSDNPLPLIDQHNYDSIFRVLGGLVDAWETDTGLEAEWEVVDSPQGDEALARIRSGYVNGLSIGYVPVKTRAASREEEAKGIRRHLLTVDLIEVSAVIYGMNPHALISPSARGKATGDLPPDQEYLRSRIQALVSLPPAKQSVLRRELGTVLERAHEREEAKRTIERSEALVRDIRLQRTLSDALSSAKAFKARSEDRAA